MHGQWIGRFEGTNQGQVVLDLDDGPLKYEGHAIAYDSNVGYPDAVIRVATRAKSDVEVVESTDISWLYPGTSRIIMDVRGYLDANPGLVLPKLIRMTISKAGNGLDIIWWSDIGTRGRASLSASEADKPSEIQPIGDVLCWSDFHRFALGCSPRKYIFRGQNCVNRLRTSFHRTRRKDLVSFLLNDIPDAHLALSSRTKHTFDLSKNGENAAFLNLLQHHGYPTPLLDWSYSPFVASFFAYKYNNEKKSEKVRIFVFDKSEWLNDFSQVKSLALARPHFSIFESLTIENLRAMPQQSVSGLTNVDDIESYIKTCENATGKTYLRVIELPAWERQDVLDHLSMMGITAGSLFLGLDGACEDLRDRYFRQFT